MNQALNNLTMEKYLIILVGAVLMVTTSCTTKEYYDVVPSISIIYQKTDSQWSEFDTYNIYTDLDVPELTRYYVEQGIVNVAMSFDNESTYNGLPATIDGVSYSYDYAVGSIRIYAQDPIMEEGIEINIPERVHFKVSLTEARYVE